ncbi:hypothetical protein ABUS21_04850 [Acinetobacter baumannii]|uniref:hypothetical protein n=1 Tax=Acinetobacter baumannii TaxID=470 RepID=UPI003D085C1A
MIAVLFCLIAFIFIFPCLSFNNQEKVLRAFHAQHLKTVADMARIDLDIEDSVMTGKRITVDTSEIDENFRDVLALRIMTCDANVDLIHDGKHIPTLKQVIERLANEP